MAQQSGARWAEGQLLVKGGLKFRGSRHTAAEPIPRASQTWCRDSSQRERSALGTAGGWVGIVAGLLGLERRTRQISIKIL